MLKPKKIRLHSWRKLPLLHILIMALLFEGYTEILWVEATLFAACLIYPHLVGNRQSWAGLHLCQAGLIPPSQKVGHYITGINKTGISSSSTRFLERLIISHKTVVISRGYKGHLCHLEDFESNLIHLNKPTHTCSESWWVSPSNYWHLGRVWMLSYTGRVHFIWYICSF